MPELPEVETTARELNRLVKGRRIVDVWTEYKSAYWRGKEEIKNPKYFLRFKKAVIGSRIVGASRRAKNVLIHLDGKHTILVHMKMTGHLLVGPYKFHKKDKKWRTTAKGPLTDPFNQYIRLVFTLDDGRHLALSDLRKFAKVALLETASAEESTHLKNLGPDALDSSLTPKTFSVRISRRPKLAIKTALIDQEAIAGIGNIYSDEALWRAKINPETPVGSVSIVSMKILFKAVREVLTKGLDFGGDSMSDYRRPDGTPGKFHLTHTVYQRKGEPCLRRSCRTLIVRKVVNGRSAHFCPKCQPVNKRKHSH